MQAVCPTVTRHHDHIAVRVINNLKLWILAINFFTANFTEAGIHFIVSLANRSLATPANRQPAQAAVRTTAMARTVTGPLVVASVRGRGPVSASLRQATRDARPATSTLPLV